MILTCNNIDYSTPYIEKHAIVRNGTISEGVVIYGIVEEALDQIFQLNQFTEINAKFKDKNSIIIGTKLAESLNIYREDEILLIEYEDTK